MTLNINSETRDLSFDEEGILELIFEDITTTQCVRLTLQTWKGEFFLDESHGTDYDRIMGRHRRELDNDLLPEVFREAIFQETDVVQIDHLSAELNDKRHVTANFSARLLSGRVISSEVNA